MFFSSTFFHASVFCPSVSLQFSKSLIKSIPGLLLFFNLIFSVCLIGQFNPFTFIVITDIWIYFYNLILCFLFVLLFLCFHLSHFFCCNKLKHCDSSFFMKKFMCCSYGRLELAGFCLLVSYFLLLKRQMRRF